MVFVRELFVKALTGVDAWRRPQPQPVSISIWLQTSVALSGSTDHLIHSLNYDVISRKVTRMVESGKFRTMEDIAERVAREVLKDKIVGQWVRIQVKKPRALLRALNSEIIITRTKKHQSISDPKDFTVVQGEGTIDVARINKLQLVTIIGVNTIERLHRQNVVIDLTLYKPLPNNSTATGFNPSYDFRGVVETVSSHVENSSYKTVEAFATSVAEVVCRFGVEKVTVRVEKPSAMTFADAAGVEITRSKEYFESAKDVSDSVAASLIASAETPSSLTPPRAQSSVNLFPQSGGRGFSGLHTAYIAFGSNVGNTIENVRRAVMLLSKQNGITKVLATSGLYQSEPMYVTDQDKFLNGVVKIETTLEPLLLLDALKDIEYKEMGRVKEVENGPRSIDLDILLYDDDLVMNHERLNIPHIGMLSRSFVLKPLIDLVGTSAVHPLTAETYQEHLDQVCKQDESQELDPQIQASARLKTVIPLRENRKLIYDLMNHKTVPTQIMAIINVTPDSFSDGGKVDMENIVSVAEKAVSQGATILDVGGMSTHPKSKDPGVEEELNRVIPAITAMRKSQKLAHIPISIDTFRSEVADRAIALGADIINDISGGQLDARIFDIAKKYQVPIVLNHTRGTPQLMTRYADYSDSESDEEDNSDQMVVDLVARELEERVNAALSAGLHRWQLILDPGIGFAKASHHNLAIIRNFAALRTKRDSLTGIPWLVGTSRKGFIGKITHSSPKHQPEQRVWGTAATVTALIAGCADIIRVHDVGEMIQVVKMSDAIYRQ